MQTKRTDETSLVRHERVHQLTLNFDLFDVSILEEQPSSLSSQRTEPLVDGSAGNIYLSLSRRQCLERQEFLLFEIVGNTFSVENQ